MQEQRNPQGWAATGCSRLFYCEMCPFETMWANLLDDHKNIMHRNGTSGQAPSRVLANRSSDYCDPREDSSRNAPLGRGYFPTPHYHRFPRMDPGPSVPQALRTPINHPYNQVFIPPTHPANFSFVTYTLPIMSTINVNTPAPRIPAAGKPRIWNPAFLDDLRPTGQMPVSFLPDAPTSWPVQFPPPNPQPPASSSNPRVPRPRATDVNFSRPRAATKTVECKVGAPKAKPRFPPETGSNNPASQAAEASVSTSASHPSQGKIMTDVMYRFGGVPPMPGFSSSHAAQNIETGMSSSTPGVSNSRSHATATLASPWKDETAIIECTETFSKSSGAGQNGGYRNYSNAQMNGRLNLRNSNAPTDQAGLNLPTLDELMHDLTPREYQERGSLEMKIVDRIPTSTNCQKRRESPSPVISSSSDIDQKGKTQSSQQESMNFQQEERTHIQYTSNRHQQVPEVDMHSGMEKNQHSLQEQSMQSRRLEGTQIQQKRNVHFQHENYMYSQKLDNTHQRGDADAQLQASKSTRFQQGETARLQQKENLHYRAEKRELGKRNEPFSEKNENSSVKAADSAPNPHQKVGEGGHAQSGEDALSDTTQKNPPQAIEADMNSTQAAKTKPPDPKRKSLAKHPSVCLEHPAIVTEDPEFIGGFEEVSKENRLPFMVALSVCKVRRTSADFLCSHCLKLYGSANRLKEHLGKALDYLPYKCTQCLFRCVVAKDARSHRRLHENLDRQIKPRESRR